MIKVKYIKLIVVIITCIILIFIYKNRSLRIPISYYDEEIWVGQSYFFEYYKDFNFDRSIWDSSFSKDQPMFTKLAFGIWLYPSYINSLEHKSGLLYPEYLLSNHFGSTSKIVSQDKNHLMLIKKVRELSMYLLVATVLITTTFILKSKGSLFGIIFFLFYSLNPILINYLLRAQSESLFLLFFNVSVIYLIAYFNKKGTLYELIAYAIFTALCFSTKLNGIMLIPVYCVLEYKYFLSNFTTKNAINLFKKILTILVIVFSVFIIVNPYTHSSPIPKIIDMFQYRQSVVQYQMMTFPDQAIHSFVQRYVYIVQVLYKDMGLIMAFFFFIGIYAAIRSNERYEIDIFILFLTLTLITGIYLQLSWERYLVHLIAFSIYYQVSGLVYCFKKLKK